MQGTANASVRVVDVYPYRITSSGPEFLLLKRSESTIYAGQWRMVGGKIRPDEPAWHTALRELREELGSSPSELWVIPSINTFYEWQQDRLNLIPAFAARFSAEPRLNHEHTHSTWLTESAARSRLQWPEQQRLLQLTARMLADTLPPELLIPPAKWPG